MYFVVYNSDKTTINVAMTTISHPPVECLIEAPEPNSPAWDVVSGHAKKEYFSRSPFAVIVAYVRGFVVENIVTGGQHPVASWEQATSLRTQLAQRYQTLAIRAGW